MRILVVEDESRIADFLSRGLVSAGYAVDVAATGGSAIDMIHSTDYDLVILDLGLPDVDGLTVLQKIRNRKVSPPVLILSARDAVDDRVKGLEGGADDYLVKPFAFVELLARVRVLLRRGQPTPEKLQVGDLSLDCIRRKVSRDGENIELAPKEFSILEYLMRNRGRPLSRTMIVEHVWDMDYDGLTNIVDVYIRHLRSKIDDKWPQKMIQTVRGIGYMLDTPDRPAEKNADNVRPQVNLVRGLRFRLTVSYLLLFSALLVVIGLYFRHNLQVQTEGDVRAVLEEVWGEAKGYLRIENARPLWTADPDDPEDAHILDRLRLVILLTDANGNVLIDSPDLRLDRDRFRRRRSGGSWRSRSPRSISARTRPARRISSRPG